MRKNNRREQKSKSKQLILIAGVMLCCAAGWWGWRSQMRTRVLGISTKLAGEKIIGLINVERAKKGLAAVTENEQLMWAAQKKGESMFAQNYWAHVAPDGTQPWQFISESGYAYQSAGENLARDFGSEESVINGWLNSPTHKANLLNGNFTETGIAILDGEIAGKPVLLVVNLFGQPKTGDGEVAQISIYERSSDSLVLAGEVIPQGEMWGAKKSVIFSPIEVLGAAAIIIVSGYLIYQLTLPPRGRKRKLREGKRK